MRLILLAAKHQLETLLLDLIILATAAGKFLPILVQEQPLLPSKSGVVVAEELVLAAVLMVFLLELVHMHTRL
jgi:hypothetical protein